MKSPLFNCVTIVPFIFPFNHWVEAANLSLAGACGGLCDCSCWDHYTCFPTKTIPSQFQVLEGGWCSPVNSRPHSIKVTVALKRIALFKDCWEECIDQSRIKALSSLHSLFSDIYFTLQVSMSRKGKARKLCFSYLTKVISIYSVKGTRLWHLLR